MTFLRKSNLTFHFRCKLKNLVGVILSREVHVKAGKYDIRLFKVEEFNYEYIFVVSSYQSKIFCASPR